MSVIDKIKAAKSPLFTFELLPPLRGRSIEKIYEVIDRLMEFDPAYINFTSHRNEIVYKEKPDGSIEKRAVRKRPGTIALAAAVKYKYDITVVPHILCGGFSREETEDALIEMDFLGIDDILALRGDPPRGTRNFIPEKEGHSHTSDLVKQVVDMNNGKYTDDSLKNVSPTNFCIGVAGYPEKHFEAPNMAKDLAYLKGKVDAGASYVVTQLFFDNSKFFKFRDDCKALGINVPIIPGIKPISAMSDIHQLPQTFSIDIPNDLYNAIEKCKSDVEAREIGVEWATQQSKELLANNVPGIHFYTYGYSDNVARIIKAAY